MTVRRRHSCHGRGIGAVAVLVCAVALLPVAPVAASPETAAEAEEVVDEAERALEGARALAERLSGELDETAARYEQARAHRHRLEEESGEERAKVDAAQQRAADAEGAFARQVASAYMRPDTDVALAESVAFAPDAATALHRAALVSRITLRQRVHADETFAAAVRSADMNRQHRIVQAGVQGAAEDAQRLGEELTVGLGNAQHRVAQAGRRLEQAVETRDRLAAEERRRREIAARGSGPLPPVDGKVCPIGAPNGFMDSWGFPRSGGRRHKGVDMFAAHGTPLYAVTDGLVRRVWSNRLGGLSVDLLADDGDRYYYAHLSEAVVESGERVRAGQVVGANGDSGNARGTPPHLHWQYHPGDGPAVNPYPLARALCR